MRRRSRSFVILVLISLGMITAGYGCADHFVLPPAQTVRHDGAERRWIPSGGGNLEAFVARSHPANDAAPRAFVLRLTGDAAGAAKFHAQRWGKRGVEMWVVNYPGYGASSGPRELSAMTPAALAAFDHIKQIAGDRPIFVEGFSLGTTPALAVAARRSVAGVFVQNPPALRQVILTNGWWNLWLLAGPVALGVPDELESMKNAARSKAPAVFMLAQRDETVPYGLQRKVADAYAGPKRVIVQKEGRHVTALNEQEERALQDAMDWLMVRAGEN